ncbi:hypothetical protein M427DRAFT_51428 [Gonapodya prolifera JEL478]|uniref:Uncharacterized protein n=1 Tax=Gonapodya prolifera (strain JEL478) TaxID=1344416 RepID=A0A139AWP0_GONPJ|nr:hypothetical protein M427DRAFT_51428 [Gonapodya prolifera JEL478]|eukprot:KXS21162.1 hypothetical protein M427DRAFT_51428 [Gonapodya prolifera JEL478]
MEKVGRAHPNPNPYLSLSRWPPQSPHTEAFESDRRGKLEQSDEVVDGIDEPEARLEQLIEEAVLVYEEMQSRLLKLNVLCATLDRVCDETSNNIGPDWVHQWPLFGPNRPTEATQAAASGLNTYAIGSSSRADISSPTQSSSPRSKLSPMGSHGSNADYSLKSSEGQEGVTERGTWTLQSIANIAGALKTMINQEILLRRTVLMFATNELSSLFDPGQSKPPLLTVRLAMVLLASWRHRPYLESDTLSNWDTLMNEMAAMNE